MASELHLVDMVLQWEGRTISKPAEPKAAANGRGEEVSALPAACAVLGGDRSWTMQDIVAARSSSPSP